MVSKKIFLFFIFLFILIPFVQGAIEQAEYYFIVEENGNTIIGANLYGSGEISLPVPKDISHLSVEGGLYILEDEKLTISIGSTKQAAVVYTTTLLTEKRGKLWSLRIPLENSTKKNITVAMPREAKIIYSRPTPLQEQTNFTKLYWENPQNIQVDYSFEPKINQNKNQNKTQEKSITSLIYVIIVFLVTIILIPSYLYFKKVSKKISGRKEQIIQTLTENEKAIVGALIEKQNEKTKRSYLAKKLNLARSSLAASLRNLERKKIISIDKTYSSHTIELQEWFKKL